MIRSAKLLAMTPLAFCIWLSISSCAPSDSGQQQFLGSQATAADLDPEVTELALSGPSTDLLRSIGRAKAVRKLWISSLGQGTRENALSAVWSLPLDELEIISSPAIEDRQFDGASHLRLKKLRFNSCINFSCKGLQNFDLSDVEYLDLRETPLIGDDLIEVVRSCTKLKQLRIRDCSLSPNGVAGLKKLLPDCRVDDE